MTDHRNKLI
jgi:hypothetical protein